MNNFVLEVTAVIKGGHEYCQDEDWEVIIRKPEAVGKTDDVDKSNH